MTHMQKPPPPGQGFLYGEASNQAGESHDIIEKSKVKLFYYFYGIIYADKGNP